MRMARAVVALTTLVVGACAPAISGSGDSISRLEQARTADPNSAAVQRSLGIAYFKANRYPDAKTALQKAVSMDANDGVAALYLGLNAEAQNDFPGARAAYDSYLRVGKTRGVKNQIRERLVVVTRKENEAAAKAGVAAEQRLGSIPGPPTTVAVMPFTFAGADTNYKPLERGFAELVTTDLSRSARLTVLERARLQSLLDEIALQRTTAVQAGTGVRAGKILQAGRLVGGSITQVGTDQLSVSAIVTNVQTTQIEGAGARGQQAMEQLFTLEKTIVLGLFTNMNITLTTAERNAIEQRPTRSLQAFLAYSRGLEAMDRGRYDDAGRQFDNAVRIDPSFGSAQQKSQEAKSGAAGAAVGVASVEQGLRGTAEGAAVTASAQGAASSGSSGSSASGVAEGLNPSTAGGATSGGVTSSTTPASSSTSQTAASATGATNPTSKTAKVTIVIQQPRP
ncbi:MAG TPA: tetratricopeptide repeat protein [Gemmatimonadaceae bacterium]|nr:tetratricopeptide repeat protein [Gemmatimonadaceae bacterium]